MEDPKKCEFFTKQFQVRRFLFNFEVPSLIGTAQCGRLQLVYVIYRTIWALWWLAIFIYSLVDAASATWLVYLTNWSLTLVLTSSGLQLIAAIYQLVKSTDIEKNTPILYKIDWIFYNMATTTALLVTIMYWAALYNGSTVTFLNSCVHAINGAYVFIDIWITGVPIRLLHFYPTVIFGFIYGIVNVIYWAASGQAVYSITDWGTNPGLAAGLIIGLVFVVVPLLQLVLFCFYWIRILLYTHLFTCCHQGKVEPKLDPEIIKGESNSVYIPDDKY